MQTPRTRSPHATSFCALEIGKTPETTRDIFTQSKILAECSPVFARMLSNGMRESIPQKVEDLGIKKDANSPLGVTDFVKVVKIEDCSPAAFEVLLGYMQDIKVELSIDFLFKVMAIARKYLANKHSIFFIIQFSS